MITIDTVFEVAKRVSVKYAWWGCRDKDDYYQDCLVYYLEHPEIACKGEGYLYRAMGWHSDLVTRKEQVRKGVCKKTTIKGKRHIIAKMCKATGCYNLPVQDQSAFKCQCEIYNSTGICYV